MLAALGPATHHVLLGTAALLPVLRRPVQAAQALASIHLLSGGRLVVAVGAGFPGRFGQPLYELSGVPWARRFARLDDGWLPYPPDPADYRSGLGRVRHSAAAAGRAAAVTPALFVSVLVTDAPDGGRRAMSDYAAASYGLSLEGLQAIQVLVAGPARTSGPGLTRRLGGRSEHGVHLDPRSLLPACAAFGGALE